MAHDNAPERIDEELVCVDSLVDYLKHRCGCSNVLVTRSKDDPPDFWVIIDGDKFAAEVTSIVSEVAYIKKCKMIETAIQESAREQEVLNGKYTLVIMRHPKLPKGASQEWNGLVEEATSFIQGTRGDESTCEHLLLKDTDGNLGIQKVSNQGATVGLIGPVEVKHKVPDVQDELFQLMQKAVNQKRQKIEKKGVPSLCSRIILLFYDAYGYGDDKDAQEALLRVNGYRWFHSIFWAASFTNRPNDLSPEDLGRKGAFLYSENERWWKRKE
jgi:hypothetical protein